MHIHTSYFAKYRQINPEWACISIANSKPAGIVIPECKQLMPEWRYVELIKQCRIDRDYFNQVYRISLDYGLSKTWLYNYFKSFNTEHIVLMCWEADPKECHRSVLMNYLKESGLDIKVDGELTDFNS